MHGWHEQHGSTDKLHLQHMHMHPLHASGQVRSITHRGHPDNAVGDRDSSAPNQTNRKRKSITAGPDGHPPALPRTEACTGADQGYAMIGDTDTYIH